MKKATIFCVLIFSSVFAGRVDICVDPGHGGVDPGTVNPRHGQGGPYEKDFNLWTANVMLDDLYWTLGYSVMATHISDEYVGLKRRTDMANGEIVNPYTGAKDTCEYFVSVHNNAPLDGNSNSHGTETYWWKTADEEYATTVHNHLWNFLSSFPYAYNRGLQHVGKYVTVNTRAPAVLCECAFVTHDVSPTAQWYQLSGNLNGILDYAGYGIDDGLNSYFMFPRPGYGCIRMLMSRAAIQLQWSICPVTVTGYNIYRSTYPDNNYTLIQNNWPNIYFTDNNCTNGGIYSYYIRGNNNGQIGNRNNIVWAQVPPFTSDNNIATGFNNATRIISGNDGVFYANWSNLSGPWFSKSTNNGNGWCIAPKYDEVGWQSSVAINSSNIIFSCYINTFGNPDPSSVKSFAISTANAVNDIWSNDILYESTDTILGISFVIDQADTGWVVFDTYNSSTGYYSIKVGKFYTLSEFDGFENVVTILTTLDGIALASIGVRTSDHSLQVAYEKKGNIFYTSRDNLGNWTTPYKFTVGHNPSLNVVGSLIHFTWESWDNPTRIQYCYTDGKSWSRTQTIRSTPTTKCYPFIEKGSIVTWSEISDGGQLDVFSSQKSMLGGWSTPQNISQTQYDSKYPQVAMYQNGSQTNLVYLWTEGNTSPYDVKLQPVTIRFDGLPFYAIDVGEKELSVFLDHRDGYMIYGQGIEKSIDYDSTCLKYIITGLDSNKTYKIGLAFYQDEDNNVWEENILIDSNNMKTVSLPRKRIIIERIIIAKKSYNDGIIELKISQSLGAKAVLAGFALWEYSEHNKSVSSIEEHHNIIHKGFSLNAYPNPAKGTIDISFNLPKENDVSLKIYSVTGQIVKMIKERYIAGFHKVKWDIRDERGSPLPNGIYFIRLVTPESNLVTKLVILN